MKPSHPKWKLLSDVCRVLPTSVAERIVNVEYTGAGHYTIDLTLPGRGIHAKAGMAWETYFLNGLDDASTALFLLTVP